MAHGLCVSCWGEVRSFPGKGSGGSAPAHAHAARGRAWPGPRVLPAAGGLGQAVASQALLEDSWVLGAATDGVGRAMQASTPGPKRACWAPSSSTTPTLGQAPRLSKG